MLCLLLLQILFHTVIFNTALFYIKEYRLYIIIFRTANSISYFYQSPFDEYSLFPWGQKHGWFKCYVVVNILVHKSLMIYSHLGVNSYTQNCWAPNQFQDNLSPCSVLGSSGPVPYLLLHLTSWPLCPLLPHLPIILRYSQFL